MPIKPSLFRLPCRLALEHVLFAFTFGFTNFTD